MVVALSPPHLRRHRAGELVQPYIEHTKDVTKHPQLRGDRPGEAVALKLQVFHVGEQPKLRTNRAGVVQLVRRGARDGRCQAGRRATRYAQVGGGRCVCACMCPYSCGWRGADVRRDASGAAPQRGALGVISFAVRTFPRVRRTNPYSKPCVRSVGSEVGMGFEAAPAALRMVSTAELRAYATDNAAVSPRHHKGRQRHRTRVISPGAGVGQTATRRRATRCPLLPVPNRSGGLSVRGPAGRGLPRRPAVCPP